MTDSLVARTASGPVGQDAGRPALGRGHELVGLDDLVEQPELERPRCGEGLGREQELHRRRERDLPRQAGGGAAAGEEASLRLHHAEGGPRRGDADVDAAEHLHAPGDARTVDGGDDRLVELHVAKHRFGAVGELAAVDLLDLARADLLRQRRDLRDVVLQVGAGHEGAGNAGDDRHPEVVVVTEVAPRLGEVAEAVEVEGVAALGPVDRDDDDVIGAWLVADRHRRGA